MPSANGSFALDPRLAADTMAVAELPLCSLRLMNDATYPWLILVPRRPGAVELIDLSAGDETELWGEIRQASEILKSLTACRKLNVAAIGNVVSQLHIHIVARNEGDPTWPAPVWGKAPPVPYAAEAAEALIAAIRARL